jgi:hypothetical protein
MKPSKIIALLVVGLLLYIGYKAIYALPNEYVKQANDFQRSYNAQKFQLNRSEKDFKNLQSTEDWAFLQPYADREEWAAALTSANTEFSAATKINNEVITPILDRDHEDDIKPLVLAIAEGNAFIEVSTRNSNYPYKRSRLILDARKYKEAYFKQILKIEPDAEKIMARFINSASISKKTHPKKTDDINSTIVVTQALLQTLSDQNSILLKEYASKNTDFALYGDTYQAILAQEKLLKQHVKESTERLQQLDRSYVKVLADQKVDYYIVIGRATWCEADGCGTGSNYRFPEAPVDADTFDYFDSLTVSTIAEKGWGSLSYNVPKARWNALNISAGKNWPSSHGYAEFWVDNTLAATYQKYTIIENDKTKETDWIRVSNDDYWKNEADLGMAIVTKPLGFYESEIITSAEPVGMSMIAEPTMVNGQATGSNQYGQWQQSNGNSFWHYYGMYSMFNAFMPSNRYSHNQWNGYNSAGRSSSYYGRNNEYGTYGASTYSNAKYKNSAYSRRNPNVIKDVRSGKISRVSNSVRGAGPSGRGKGPSGGGK